MFGLLSLVEIEDLVVLPEPVTVKIAVGIIEQDAFGVGIGERPAPLHRLPEGRGIFEREPLLAERIAEAHPGAFLAARRAAMAFVNKDEAVTSKASMAMVLSPFSSFGMCLSRITSAERRLW